MNNFSDFLHFLHWLDLVAFRRDLDLEISRSNMEFAYLSQNMLQLPWNKKQTSIEL